MQNHKFLAFKYESLPLCLLSHCPIILVILFSRLAFVKPSEDSWFRLPIIYNETF